MTRHRGHCGGKCSLSGATFGFWCWGAEWLGSTHCCSLCTEHSIECSFCLLHSVFCALPHSLPSTFSLPLVRFSSLFEQSSLSSLLVLLPELGYLVSTARPRMAPAAAASDATLFLFLFSGQSGSSSLCSSFGSTLASALTYELRVDLHVSHCPCPCSGCCRRCRCFACHHYYQIVKV